MKITIEHLKDVVLPGLRRKYRDDDEFLKQARVFIDENEIADADGNPITADAISIMTTMPAEGDDGAEEGASTEGEPKGEPAEPKLTDADIQKAVDEAVKKERAKHATPGYKLNLGVRDKKAPADAIPASVKHERVKHVSSSDAAYKIGHYALGITGMFPKSAEIAKSHGWLRKDQTGSSNPAGGYLVPDEFSAEVIRLVEEYGVFRRNARVVRMTSDTYTQPRRSGGVTAYGLGEADSITESDMTFDRVQLVAKKIGALSQYTSELSEDAAVAIGDQLAFEFAWAFAKKEDECGFVGDGTSTYLGITGVTTALTALSGTIGNIAGLTVGTGNAYSELTLGDFEAVLGNLPEYAETPNTKWYVSKPFWANVMVRVANDEGGNSRVQIEDGPQKRFLGYPVEIAQVMPRTAANSQVCALFGDLSLAALFGDRRSVTVATSEQYAFNQDILTIRGTERFDINVHDVGNASATASSRQPGPIVGLITAAS